MTDPGTGCTSTETIQMAPPATINITSATIQNITCAGAANGVISISTDNSSGVSYSWTPNAGSAASLNFLSPGIYSVMVTNEDLCSDDSSFVVTEPAPIIVTMIDSLGSECGEANGYLTVSANGGQGGFSYAWTNGANGSTNSGIDEGNYTITVTDLSGCSVNQTFDLGCTPLIPIVVPQLITPNNDGKNDKMMPLLVGITRLTNFRIWNRWGQLVYQTQKQGEGWDGIYQGVKQPMETFLWIAEGLDIDGKIISATGSFILVR